MWLEYGKAFIAGGALCALGQILIDRTKLTPARILTLYVITGVFLSGIGIYDPLLKWAGAGVSVPLTGFGHLLAAGIREAVAEKGLLGVFTGGFTASAAGISGAVFFALTVAILFNPREKK